MLSAHPGDQQTLPLVIPAKAGTHFSAVLAFSNNGKRLPIWEGFVPAVRWTPASAGATKE